MDLTHLLSRSATPTIPAYKGVESRSFYLTMADGTRIAVDLMLPKGLGERRVPTVMRMTRYWRSFAVRGLQPSGGVPISANMEQFTYLIARGFAVVSVDARGSGASFGVHTHPWSPAELDDYAQVVDWVRAQPWSSGRVGAIGFSYEGVTAELLAAVARVDLVVPQQTEWDIYTDIAMPGGIRTEAFIQAWSDSNNRQDQNQPAVFFPWFARLLLKGVRPVDGDGSGALLRQALAEHQANPPVYPAVQGITHREDEYAPGVTLDSFSPFSYRQAVAERGAAIFNWGSWLDAATADTVIRRFNTISGPMVGVIGAWSHDGTSHASPYAAPRAKPSPTMAERREIEARTLAAMLSDEAQAERVLLYYTLGEERWKQTNTFPPAGFAPQRWYLQEGGSLGIDPPGTGEGGTDASEGGTDASEGGATVSEGKADASEGGTDASEGGADTYVVDFRATTGPLNRWQTGLAKPVRYGDRAAADRLLLTYTSEPLASDAEITGYPVVTLHLASTHADGALYVYLEDVDPQGGVRYVTDGQLRLIHRALSQVEAPYWTGGPARTYGRSDARPVEPGRFEPVVLTMLPTSVLVRRGHRLRIAIAGHDADTFVRVPETGTPTLTVARQAGMASYVELPVQYR